MMRPRLIFPLLAFATVIGAAIGAGALGWLHSGSSASPPASVADSRAGRPTAISLLAWPTLTPTPVPTEAPPVEVVAPPTVEPTQAPLLQNAPPPAPTEVPTGQPSPPPVVSNAPPPAQGQEWWDTDYTAQVMAGINAERTSRGLTALSVNAELQSSAMSYAQLLTQLHTLTHTANGSDPVSRALASGYPSDRGVGEVLWYGAGVFLPQETVSMWMASPAHHDILLTGTFTQAGAACYVFITIDAHETRCVVDLGD